VSLLLDTHIFLWLIDDDRRLTARARQLILDASQVFVSTVSIWEIAIKSCVGKIHIDPAEADREIQICGFRELNVTNRHAIQVASLPLLHNDPFDRILVAQAMTEPLHFLTADVQLAAYSPLVITI
jgi:PIN domain nuclease of toxin-antitoxin system